ncbi:MAG: hypothetical protein DWQ36_10900 [Acidobacteria bacterium]|mgnify:CR=1 FL=1|nr:MAG: hypothetical protein DWQ30_12500 [Acidobacteriota bacterium]REK07719.1 MAG: hypothetical protein DWQ36_10900 [Acidobacteriota bacterium]
MVPRLTSRQSESAQRTARVRPSSPSHSSSSGRERSRPSDRVEGVLVSAPAADEGTSDVPAAGEFADHLELVLEVLQRRCRLQLHSLEEREEFPSWAIIRLIERWPRLVAEFQGRARFSSYLDRVVENLLRDYRIEKWGKWRASQHARRRGLLALELEHLVYRERWAPEEAIESLVFRARCRDESSRRELRQRLWELLADLPRRDAVPLQLDPDLIANWCADPRCQDGGAQLDEQRGSTRLTIVLVVALGELDERARALLYAYFVAGTAYVEVADESGQDRRDVYNLAHRSLRKMRRLFERRGLGRPEFRRLLDGIDLGRPLEWIFAAASCPEGRAWAERQLARAT